MKIPKPGAPRIALIGIGCRLPGGVSNPEELKAFLHAHGDGVKDVPADRWSLDLFHDPEESAPGKTYTKQAGFLEQDIFTFDPAPFGISPREAERLDPQQRLLHEVTWEALEDAGIPMDRLKGSNTGVYIGGFMLDYQSIVAANRHRVDIHTATGMSHTVLSNRLSYTFDLRGPSFTVDTACSSSLVTTHLACRGLIDGECDLAIAGGVNIMLSPLTPIVMSKGQFLSKDGRSKAFDARADGYGRGEGVGLIVLKRLEKAIADNDRIYAVILGTGINQDGRTDGLPMPNGEAQERLCETVLSSAGIEPWQVGYVEAHGTGTPIGDPTEARALGAAYCQHRARGEPLLIGSLKTNFGHLEAAAGVTGLIKAALSVYHREIFPQRALDTPNPDIPFDDLNLRVSLESRPWPHHEGPAIAAINSFGYGGANAHALIGEYLDAEPTVAVRPIHAPDAQNPKPARFLVPISAFSREALSARAGQLAGHFDDKHASWRDAAYTLAERRTHLPERAVIIAANAPDIDTGLQRLARKEESPAVVSGRAPREQRLLWVFTGMGPQWWGMGQELYRTEPVFRTAIETADRHFQRIAGWSILTEMLRDESASRMPENAIAQPANLVLQIGLVELLRHLGVPEQGFLGHSVGELAAAWAGGCLSLEDAIHIAYHRGQLQQTVAGGTLLAVALSPEEAESLIPEDVDVSIAAYNAPRTVTLAGSRADLEAIAAKLGARGTFNSFVPVEIAYHSPHMEPLKDRFLTALSAISPMAPTVPFYSTTWGREVDTASHDAGYWWQNLRDPVLLQQALECAIQDGYTAFIEIGPHPVLGASIREVLGAHGVEGISLSALDRREAEGDFLYGAVARLFTVGVPLDWSRRYPTGSLVSLPAYPFQRARYWDESEASREARLGRPGAMPLLSQRESGPYPRFVTDLGHPNLRYLRDHQVLDAVVFPASGYIEAALCAHQELHEDKEAIIENIRFQSAFVLRGEGTPWLRIEIDRHDEVEFFGRHDEGEWRKLAEARFLPSGRLTSPARLDIAETSATMEKSTEIGEFREQLSGLGLEYGPAFQRIVELSWRRISDTEGEVLARLRAEDLKDYPGRCHPALLDAAFQALIALTPKSCCSPIVPVAIDRVRQTVSAGEAAWVHGKADFSDENRISGNVRLLDAGGRVLVAVDGLVCQPLESERTQILERTKDWLYADAWVPHSPDEDMATPNGSWTLIGHAGTPLDGLLDTLNAAGARAKSGNYNDGNVIGDDTHVVFVCSPQRNGPLGTEHCAPLLALARRLIGKPRQLRIVTFGAQSVLPKESVQPTQTAVWGMAHVIMTEHPELSCRLIDLPASSPFREETLIDLLSATQEKEETALRGETVYAKRLQRTGVENQTRRGMVNGQDVDAFELYVDTLGSLGDLAFRTRERRTPEAHEVEVEVITAGMNFKDIAKTFGILTETALAGASMKRSALGVEGYGKALRVGKDVTRVRPGEDVCFYCCPDGSMASHATLSESLVIPAETTHSAIQGATYFVFITAWHGLLDAARLRQGESVLIHSAAGGVGLACVQIARLRGAEIHATAGTPEKRDYLKKLGIRYVHDSRTLDFPDAIMRDTGGRGVDVVVNALPGPTLEKSLGLLAHGGRFVELGKHDIANNGSLGLLPFNRGLSFIAVDLDRAAAERPDCITLVAKKVLRAFAKGRLEPLPTRVFPTREAIDAFRLLASGDHIGKVVMDFSDRDVKVATGITPSPLFRPDRSYLVTGGLGGFGLETAAWMVEKGARTLVLGSRRGSPDSNAERCIARLRDYGARVECVRLDVTRRDSIREVLRSIEAGLPPLAGIFHAAAVLEDAPIREATGASLDRVMTAKAHGAWLLHQETTDLDLDHFVFYSSGSYMIGNPGQAAYAAANAYLDGLTALRRAESRAATCVHWGPIADVGMVARDAAAERQLQALGMSAIPPKPILRLLGELLREDREHVAIVGMDWDKWMRTFPETPWNRLEELGSAGGEDGQGPLVALRLALAGKNGMDAMAIIIPQLKDVISDVLRVPVERLDATTALKDYGLDSLMAIELRNTIERTFGISLATVELLAAGSLEGLARQILDRVEPQPDTEKPSIIAPADHRTPAEFCQWLLERIEVQPPYFAFTGIERRGEWLEADVTVTPPPPREAALVSVAEAARHLAILGSCAASLQCPLTERVYYPVRSARMIEHRYHPDSGSTKRLRARAHCTHFDLKASQASSEMELLDAHGEVVYRFGVDYHIIPEPQFRTLFRDNAQKTREESGHDPHATVRELPPVDSFRDGVAIEMVVDPEWCLGHFVGYPAYPVAIMLRDVMALIAEGIRRRHGWRDVRVTGIHGGVVTERFVFAHERAVLRVYPISRSEDAEKHTESWRCDVLSGHELAASFQVHVAAHGV
uniref:Epothilone polyketide synthase D n=1 Tax=Candidatus Kentrum sp. FW TaxID=2126338 RepID=A0A450TT63_9GAMM|nr:MAG: epothilone polyketide synthase D [Candidatus Kentron sp. FW]